MSPACLESLAFQRYWAFFTKPALDTRMSEAGGPREPAGYLRGSASPRSMACSSGVNACPCCPAAHPCSDTDKAVQTLHTFASKTCWCILLQDAPLSCIQNSAR